MLNFLTEKQKIDSGYFFHQVEIKIKNDKKERKADMGKGKMSAPGLGEMFEMNDKMNDFSDVPVVLHQI